ncbi:hypothetical protein GmHk_09G026278 [Glycine max]|nr:hypothetical protein GmHk_09G026278 [Glycine max]
MAGREVREYTNLSDPKDKKWGKGKDKIDDEDITFQRMVAKMQEVAGERGGYLHGRGALDSDDLLYLKEQMEAEEDAERLLHSSPASVPLAFRVEPKPKSGIRQQDLLKKVVEIKPKRPRSDANRKPDHDPSKEKEQSLPRTKKVEEQPLSGSKKAEEHAPLGSQEAEAKPKVESSSGGLLGLAYDSSDDDE